MVPTAPSASVPRHRPTMTVSAKLYSCWNKVPSTSGKANRKIWNSGLPTVRSVVPERF